MAAPTVDVGDGELIVNWVQPLLNGSGDITKYTITVTPANAAAYDVVIEEDVNGDLALSATIDGLTNGVEYTFTVTATNGFNLTSDDSLPTSAIPITKFSQPTDLDAIAVSGTQINLTWTAPPPNPEFGDLIGYEIERHSGDDNFVVIVITTGNPDATEPSYNDLNLFNGITYTYRVSAINAIITGDASLPASAITFDVPDAPVLTVTTDDNIASISWTVPFDHGSALEPYTLTITDTTTNDPPVVSNPAAIDESTTATLINGHSYTIIIYANNAIGRSLDSEPVFVSPFGKPDTMAAPIVDDVGDHFVDLSWVQPGLNGSGDITKYTITVTPANAAAYDVVIEDVNGDLVLFTTIDLLDNGVLHTFTITATNENNQESDDSLGSTATPFGASNTMAAPIVDDVGNNFVDLSWVQPLLNGSGDITKYTITVTPANAAPYDVVIEDEDVNGDLVLFTTIDLLDNGVLHTFTITATNGFGEESDDSDPVTATPFGKPDTMAAPIVDDVGNNFVDLSWVQPIT